MHAPHFGKYWVANCPYRRGMLWLPNQEPVRRSLWRLLYQE